MNLFFQPQISEGINYLDEEESRHSIRVLRKQAGDNIQITDGKGHFYSGRILKADSHRCTFDIIDKWKEEGKEFSIHIAISPTKNADRLEWFVEKAVELGIDKITPVECKTTERTFIKAERLNKVAISAMKQSLKATLPVIEPLTPFAEFIQTSAEQEKFIAAVDPSNPLHLKQASAPRSEYVVMIGPEGDFTKEELAMAASMGFRKVSLGNSRLRTETAGIAACHILHIINT